MTQSDILYRAFVRHKEETESDRACSLERDAISTQDIESDELTTIRSICHVDEDWIEATETGLEFVRKAIDEGRQFIRTRGEVVPIERVRRVSKDSAEHLARHSDFITKEQEGSDLIPDKLYVVERLSDYAVYENRFLYMLLSHLRSFIGFRYDKILELSNTFNGKLSLQKNIAVGKRKLTVSLNLVDQRKDDAYLKQHNPIESVLNRIDVLLKTIDYFKKTPLMLESAKAPLLKPPISKTNVLKMNQNFKGAVRLYEFISSYDKPGYTVESQENRVSPFPSDVAYEFSEAILLTSQLAYKHGLGLEDALKKEYVNEQERRRAKRDEEEKAYLQQLRRKIMQSGLDPEEYMLRLEMRNRKLEKESAQLAESRRTIKTLRQEVKSLNDTIASQSASLEERRVRMALQERKHKAAFKEQEQKFKEECDALAKSFQTELDVILEAHELRIKELLQQQDEKVGEVMLQLEKAAAEHKQELEELIEKNRVEVERITTLYTAKNIEYEILEREKRLSDARLNALRKELGLIDDEEDFTTQAAFDEIEQQFHAFKAFYMEEWKKTKKRIRREVLQEAMQGRKRNRKKG